MNTINFNGQLLSTDTPILGSGNRGLRYGDGLFETMRVSNGRILWSNRHWKRLDHGMGVLNMTWPPAFDQSKFEREILRILPDNSNYRIRFNVWRSGEGLYTPQNNQIQFVITAEKITSSPFPFSKTGIQLHLFEKIHLSPSILSPLKTTNALPYILAGIAKTHNSWDDCLLLNTAGRIAEASSSNVFIIQGTQILTPALSEACIAGVMRSLVIDLAPKLELELLECPLTTEDIENAEELFLTNSIQGIRWVKSYKNSTFGHSKTEALHRLLCESIQK